MKKLADIMNARANRDVSNRNTVIELPQAVDDLIDDKNYRPKFRKLIREGHLESLKKLAGLAPKMATKEPPSHWFARCTSKARWSETLAWLVKQAKIERLAHEVGERLNIADKHMKPIYKACWRLGHGVVRHAVTAAEVGKDKLKFFCWLTRPADHAGGRL